MDTEYVLTCAVEFGELTPLEAQILQDVKGAYPFLRQAVEADATFSPGFMANLAKEAYRQAPLHQKNLWCINATAELPIFWRFLIERAEHKVQQVLQRDLGIADSPLICFEGEPAPAAPRVTDESEITEGVVHQLLTDEMGSTLQRWSDMLQELQLAQTAGLTRVDAQAQPELAQPLELPAFLVAHKKKLEKASKVAHRSMMTQAKAAVKKATKLFESYGQRENLRMFVSGGEIVLEHPSSEFRFVVKPLDIQGWLLDRTTRVGIHTPYELSLFTKEDVFLSKLCVYFKDTPVLDQLLALSIFVSSGNEMQILESANWYGSNTQTRKTGEAVLQKYPNLVAKLPKEGVASRLSQVEVPAWVVEQDVHWAPFKGRAEQWIRSRLANIVDAVDQMAPAVTRAQELLALAAPRPLLLAN